MKRKDKKMKKIVKLTVSAVLALACIFSLLSCYEISREDRWAEAIYVADTELGEGKKTAVVEVKVGDNMITFTIHTDKSTVGEALMEHKLISGENSEYGLYVKRVNGILADYDADRSYWAFYIDGEYALTGVDSAPIVKGEIYRLEYTK